MRPVAAWDDLGLSRTKMLAMTGAAGTCVTISVLLAASGTLGAIGILVSLAAGVMAAFVVAVSPERMLERSAVLQAREAPALAASAAVYLESTGSRAKTVMTLESGELRLHGLFQRAKRRNLLGFDVTSELSETSSVRSDSVAAILGSVSRAQGDRLEDEGEELEGIVRSSLSGEETKFPVFLAVSFFLPIMLMLLAAISRHDDPASLVGLAFVELVVLDLVLGLVSMERRRLAG